jgi:hypothetical protein
MILVPLLNLQCAIGLRARACALRVPGTRGFVPRSRCDYTPCMQPRIMALAVAAILISASLAEAATCLPSPAAVRRLQPKAWPQWTRGPEGKRCWFAGKKPVFARATPRRPKPAPRRTPKAEREWDFQSGDPIWQPWSMEYRWDESLSRNP